MAKHYYENDLSSAQAVEYSSCHLHRRKKVDNEHHYLSLAMKLGLIHDILKKRSHILSQVQRVIAVGERSRKSKMYISNKIVSSLLLTLFVHYCGNL